MRTEFHKIALFLGVSAIVPASANAYCQMTTDDPTAGQQCPTTGEKLLWKERCVSYQFAEFGFSEFTDPSMGWSEASLREVFETAFSQWTDVRCGASSAVTGLSVTIAEGRSSETRATYEPTDQNVSSIIFQREWQSLDYDASAYALTTTYHNVATGEIVDVDMEIDQPNYYFYDCSTRSCTNFDIDLLNVVTHEAGHTFGLGHSRERDATMYFQSPPGELSKRSLDADDIAGLCASYPPGTFTDACDYEWRDNTRSTKKKGCAVSAPGRDEGSFWFALSTLALAMVLRARRRTAKTSR